MRFSFGRAAALLAFITLASSACDLPANPRPALFQNPWVLEVGDYRVDLAGGRGRYTIEAFRNGMDTFVGTYGYAFSFDSRNKQWFSEFEMEYDGESFLDDRGARYDVAELADGAAVPGTHWVKLDATALRSRGGRRYDFDPSSGELVRISQDHSPYPRLVVTPDLVQQCRSESVCEDLFVITRDADDRIREIRSRDRTAAMSWTTAGQLAVLRQSGDVEAARSGFRFEYEKGYLSAIVNPADERLEVSHSVGRVTEIIQLGEGDPRYQFVYGTTMMTGVRRNVTLVIDPRGGRRSVAYDDALQVEGERNQAGEITRWSWLDGEIASRTDPSGAVHSWQRSGVAGEIVSETQPSGNVVVSRYAPDSINADDPLAYPLAYREDSLGPIRARGYDSQGRLTTIVDIEGYREDFYYGASGISVSSIHLRAGSDPFIHLFPNYDFHGRPVVVGVYNPLQTLYRERVYNEAGDLLNGDTLDPDAPGRPGVVENHYDHNRYLSRKDLDFGSSATVVLLNRFDGQLLSVTRPYGGTTSFHYDDLGRQTSRCDVVDGADQCTAMEYDLNSNLVLITRADGASEHRSYDAANREISLTYSKPDAEDMMRLQYWQDGRLAWTEDSAYGMQRESYVYAASGELAATDFPAGERLEVERDYRGRVTELRLLVPDGASYATTVALGWEYDGVDRPTHLYEDGLLLAEDSYQDDRIARHWTANGNTNTWTYASAWFGGQLETTYTSGPTILAESTFFREPGDLRVMTSLSGLPSGEIVDLVEHHHSTDPLYEDTLGSFVTGWGEDPENAYLPELRYVYDSLGNVELVSGSSAATHPTSQVSWNAEHNRVVSAFYDGETIQYVYNAAGEVVERGGIPVTRNAMGAVVGYGSWSAEKDTQGRIVSLQGGGRIFGGLVEADAAGNPKALDLPSVRIEFGEGANTHYFKYRDFRGNLQRVDDDSGSPVVFYHYDPFGVADVFGALPDMPEHTFVAGLAVEGGLVLTGRRVLDPACKCYWSNDPIFHSLTQIAYTPNPLALSDPNGEQANPNSAPAAIAGGAVVVAAAVAATGVVAVAAWMLGVGLIGLGIYLTFSF